ELAGEARLVLLVTDASRPLDGEERAFMAEHAGRVLLVRNKIDLLDEAGRAAALAAETVEDIPVAAVSAKSGLGLEGLGARLRAMALCENGVSGAEPEQGDLVPNLRQSELLAAALAEADALAEDVASAMPCDLFSVRLDAMAMQLGEITGYAATDDILGRIFSSFCIGK
ncbi:MAG: tRNA uridine-5-carboxymethylaminomethyl(34) synthesis GTPase MnmE, partial [Deltaproteobacteria bacterium]|nr:tRNA uridine-5-carboxymethylaminomethyl(34) synthesis GTPase MnmE [Deltaproteobacteria bacterium]